MYYLYHHVNILNLIHLSLLLYGSNLYIVYYISGLLFDTFHAIGNFAFYLICAPILMKLFKKELSKSSYTRIEEK